MRRCTVLALAAVVPIAYAADPVPEIRRPKAAAQAVGAAHTVRTIPEACARLEGLFTGDAAQPYRFAAVRTSPACQPRARLVDAAKVRPSVQAGWVFHDVIRVPDAGCPTRHAVVRVWRKPAQVAPPPLDAQGRARLYLQESRQAAEAGRTGAVPMFAATMALEGGPCG
jgi:hypothetical protein